MVRTKSSSSQAARETKPALSCSVAQASTSSTKPNALCMTPSVFWCRQSRTRRSSMEEAMQNSTWHWLAKPSPGLSKEKKPSLSKDMPEHSDSSPSQSQKMQDLTPTSSSTTSKSSSRKDLMPVSTSTLDLSTRWISSPSQYLFDYLGMPEIERTSPHFRE